MSSGSCGTAVDVVEVLVIVPAAPVLLAVVLAAPGLLAVGLVTFAGFELEPQPASTSPVRTTPVKEVSVLVCIERLLAA
ncbi:MAG TPA: hypothetical protein VGY76_08410 [Solirubrobacteraceae bacterium]|nr:hypothetical protein [Solirubrobacteraceae bacterium]